MGLKYSQLAPKNKKYMYCCGVRVKPYGVTTLGLPLLDKEDYDKVVAKVPGAMVVTMPLLSGLEF